MARYFSEYKSTTLTEANETIKILEMKILNKYKLKEQMKQNCDVLRENINLFKDIYDIDGGSDNLKRQESNNDASSIKIECPELPSSIESIFCIDASFKVKELKYQLYQVDYFMEIAQYLKENIMIFEEMVCNLLLQTNSNEKVSFIQDEMTIDSSIDYKSEIEPYEQYEAIENCIIDTNLEFNVNTENYATEYNLNNPLNDIPEVCQSSNVNTFSITTENTNTVIDIDTDTTAPSYSSKRYQKVFRCDMCHLKFSSAYKRKIHRLTIHQTKSPIRSEFQENQTIRINAARNNNNQYICDICGKTFTEFDKIRSHIIEIHRKLYRCNICDEMFSHFYLLKKHKLIHIDKETRETEYSCDICNKKFYTRTGLRYHMTIHNSTEEGHKCKICGKICSRGAYLKYHMMTNHGFERPYKCTNCSRSFLILSALKRHTELSHNFKISENNNSTNLKTSYNCNKCCRQYVTLIALKRHLKLYHNQDVYDSDYERRQFICETCGLRFNTNPALQQHKDIHSTKVYQCEICCKQFTRRNRLYLHNRKEHHKLLECVVCEKKYVNQYSLATHKCAKLSSSGLKFICEICNKQFSCAGNLTRHRLIHRNIKRFKCHVCLKDFSQKTTLNSHLKTHNT